MSMCPICNGLATVTYSCESCEAAMEDCGKTMDYLDDYSAYMDQDVLEKVDGLSHEDSSSYCLHIYHCPVCEQDTSIKIQKI